MTQLFDFILHIDEHLITIVNSFGPWTYVILFAMVFIETGVVVFPFLPGDSLLFAASALQLECLDSLRGFLGCCGFRRYC